MDTIFSLVTKKINQNVGIIRVSGEETFSILKNVFKIEPSNNEKLIFKKVFFDDVFIDECIFLIFKNPNSFTGEDLFEIQFHGSVFISNKILEKLSSTKARQSLPGEFMKQAFFNGKIDLTQSEAINEIIINDSNEKILEISSQNLNKKQSIFLDELINYFNNIIARMQVAIDYPENSDLPEYNIKNIYKQLEKFNKKIEQIIFNSNKLIKTNKGINITIAGAPNVGKSTLFNSIISEDKAIISDQEGTTRDVVEQDFYINGLKVNFQDTAGIRMTDNLLEKKGIEKTNQKIEQSDLILLIFDPLQEIKEQEKEFNLILKKHKNKTIKIINKSDLSDKRLKEYFYVSAKQNKNIDLLIKKISKFIDNNIFNFDEKLTYLINEKQILNFKNINYKLIEVIEKIKKDVTEDIIFFDIEEILKLLNSILGVEINEEYFNDLFGSFCIGK